MRSLRHILKANRSIRVAVGENSCKRWSSSVAQKTAFREREKLLGDFLKSEVGKQRLKQAMGWKLLEHMPDSELVSWESYFSFFRSGTHSDSSEHSQLEVQALSSALTFPVTIGKVVNSCLHPSGEDKMNICLVGARAESSLPMLWWKHILYTLPQFSQVNIRCIGPEMGMGIPSSTKTAQSLTQWQSKSRSRCSELTFRKDSVNDSCVLHNHTKLAEILDETHCFVLFHPGFGHSKLAEGWRDSIITLLESKKPIICTAMHKVDLDRDLNRIAHLFPKDHVDWLLSPRENPFCSTREQLDESQYVYRTNQWVYALQGKKA